MKKKTILLVIILTLVFGGFFWLWTWQPEGEPGEKSQPPTLFSREDYKIEERADGKFIVVEKVGLTCKVPEGWKIEVEGDDIPEPGYWVNLYSSDFGTTTGNILEKGCIISITAQIAEKIHQELVENIEMLRENPENAIKFLKEDYVLADDFRIMKINNYYALELISSEDPVMGGGKSVNIPFEDYKLVSIGIGFPLGYKEKCSLIWEEFLKDVVIK